METRETEVDIKWQIDETQSPPTLFDCICEILGMPANEVEKRLIKGCLIITIEGDKLVIKTSRLKL